jgi:hypothetical protein
MRRLSHCAALRGWMAASQIGAQQWKATGTRTGCGHLARFEVQLQRATTDPSAKIRPRDDNSNELLGLLRLSPQERGYVEVQWWRRGFLDHRWHGARRRNDHFFLRHCFGLHLLRLRKRGRLHTLE